MVDCKTALTEAGGDLEKAIDWLRKKGLAKAAKKAGRVAAEGLVSLQTSGSEGIMIEVNTETDFVGRNDLFQQFIKNLVSVALDKKINTLEALEGVKLSSGNAVKDDVSHLIATIGENIQLRRFARLVAPKEGAVVSYIHNAVASGCGRIGVLVALESSAPQDKLQELGRKLAMHVAAAERLLCLSIDQINPEDLERERTVLIEQAQSNGRPADIIEKMVAGRLQKFYEEVVLEEQIFLIEEGKKKISDVIKEAEKNIGHPIKLTGFTRFILGEGIEREEKDFAEEVKAQLS